MPAIVRELPRGAPGRLYDFTDLVSLRVLAKLRGKVPDGELRSIQPALRRRAAEGWANLRIVVRDRHLDWVNGEHDPEVIAAASTIIDVS